MGRSEHELRQHRFRADHQRGRGASGPGGGQVLFLIWSDRVKRCFNRCRLLRNIDVAYIAAARGDGTRGIWRRLITLISAGRNRIVMIRRELPRTEGAGWVGEPYRTKVRRFLLSVSSRSATGAAGLHRHTNLRMSRSSYARFLAEPRWKAGPAEPHRANESLPPRYGAEAGS